MLFQCETGQSEGAARPTAATTLAAEVGDRLVGGSPLGITGPGQPLVTLELRKDGQPVNPLDQLGR